MCGIPVYIIVIALVLCIIMFYISAYNKLRRLSVKVEEGSAGIDVALEKRYDMLSEEIEAVKKFLQHEYDTYLAVTSVRAGKDLEEETLQQKKMLSEEALKTIDTIKAQQSRWIESKNRWKNTMAPKNIKTKIRPMQKPMKTALQSRK